MKCYLYSLVAAVIAIGLPARGPALAPGGADGGGIVELGNLKSQVPADWIEVPPDNPRWYKQFRLEPINDDTEPARLSIAFAGKEKAANAAEYVKTRLGQLFPPSGKTTRDEAEVRKLTVQGAAVTYVDAQGDYKGVPGNDATPRENFRLLGAYFPTLKGAYLVCLFGPADTVGANRHDFEEWIKAFK
jgi:hypothetical protein